MIQKVIASLREGPGARIPGTEVTFYRNVPSSLGLANGRLEEREGLGIYLKR